MFGSRGGSLISYGSVQAVGVRCRPPAGSRKPIEQSRSNARQDKSGEAAEKGRPGAEAGWHPGAAVETQRRAATAAASCNCVLLVASDGMEPFQGWAMRGGGLKVGRGVPVPGTRTSCDRALFETHRGGHVEICAGAN